MKLHYQAHLDSRVQTFEEENTQFCHKYHLIYITFVDVNENNPKHGNFKTNFNFKREKMYW